MASHAAILAVTGCEVLYEGSNRPDIYKCCQKRFDLTPFISICRTRARTLWIPGWRKYAHQRI